MELDLRLFREKGREGITGERFRYANSKARFRVVAAGRRSGKTVITQGQLVDKLWERKPWSDPRYFYAAPTWGQAEQIAWQRFKQLIPRELIRSISESTLSITTVVGSSLWLLGLDAPQRMEGRPWDGGICDEFADMKPGTWAAHVRPSLSDRKGFCWFIGTPDFEASNSAEFRDLFHRGLDPNEKDWESFTWPSSEVIDDDEIAGARRDLPPNIFRQEYEASWESAPGRAYPDFTRSVHANTPFEYDPSHPLFVHCDFNREHHNWGLSQRWGEGYSVLEDLYLNGGTVEAMCNLAKSRIAHYGAKNVVFYGDYSGEQRRAEATDSSWNQIRQTFKGTGVQFAYETSPPITDRLEKTNSYILNAERKVRFRVHPQAKNHIRDFEEVSRAMLFGGSKSGELTHASDAVGYMIWQNSKPPRTAPAREPILFY